MSNLFYGDARAERAYCITLYRWWINHDIKKDKKIMNTKEIDVNITNVIPSTRQAASFIGALLGKAYTEVECKDIWAGGAEGFEKSKKDAQTPGISMLITNRSPRKYTLRTKDILGANFDTVGVGEAKTVGISINSRHDGTRDLFFPLTSGVNPVVTEKPIEDAIEDALHSEGDNFFLDADKVAKVLNDANRAEVKNIDALVASLNKMKQNIQGAIIENEKKAAEISKQWADSKMEGVSIKDILGGNTSVINVHTATE